MKRRSLAWLTAAGLLATGLSVPAAVADPPAHNPGGPCIVDQQAYVLASVAGYDEAEHSLATIANNSRGTVEVHHAGLSGEGRNLTYATVGTGDTVVWLQARIHGNELHSTEAVLQILQRLGGNSQEARMLRDELTVVVIPLYNPDGAEADTRRSTTPTQTDLNRDWENFVQPESAAWWKVFAEVDPNIGLDLHHMSSAPRVEDTSDLNQFQIGTFTVDPSRLLPSQADLARQMTEVSIDALDGYGQTHLARYFDIDVTNAVLSRMLLGGTAPAGEDPSSQSRIDGAIFYEVRSVGQKSNGYLEQLFIRPTMAVLTAAADGSLYESDWADYDQLPYADFGRCG